jgi:hypothetical protein
VTNPERMEAVLEDPLILIHEKIDLIDRDFLESVSVAPRRIQGREERGQVGTLTCGFMSCVPTRARVWP